MLRPGVARNPLQAEWSQGGSARVGNESRVLSRILRRTQLWSTRLLSASTLSGTASHPEGPRGGRLLLGRGDDLSAASEHRELRERMQ